MASEGRGGGQKKLQDILKLSLKLSDQELQTYKDTEMDKERKEWLRHAIENALEDDVGKKLALFTNLLQSYDMTSTLTDGQLSDLSNIFENLNFLVEGLDMAKDFNKLGGLKCCLNILKSQYTSLQWRAADLIANCTQNNPPCQKTMLENNGIEILLHILRNTELEIVQLKCIYALSATIGEHEESEKLFIRLKGVDYILKLLRQSDGKIKIKSSFLLRKVLCNEFNKEGLDFRNIYKIVMGLLKEQHDDSHENIAVILHLLLSKDGNILKLHKSMENEFQLFLKDKIAELTQLDASKYEDEIQLYKRMSKL